MVEIWVAGSPSFVGGADTELHHQIVLWRNHNVDVHIVPNNPDAISADMSKLMLNIGCKIEEYRPDIFKDKVVVSYCNGILLKRLSEICQPEHKPSKVIWFNCMTWYFDHEVTAIRNGWITHLGFVSRYQRDYLMNEWAKQLPEMCVDGRMQFGVNGFPEQLNYSPYLDITQFDVLNKTNDYFGVGRISRADPHKFSADCWRIFDRVLTPGPKKTFILGWSDDVGKRVGAPPDGLDWQWWTAGAISAREFYSRIDVMIHKTGGSRESYCRVLVEAMAYGIVPLVERNFAFPEILSKSDALSKFCMCDSSEEMSFKASCLAFDATRLRILKTMCREYAVQNFNNANLIKGWLEVI